MKRLCRNMGRGEWGGRAFTTHHQVSAHVEGLFAPVVHVLVLAEAEEDGGDDRLEHLREDEAHDERAAQRQRDGQLHVADVQTVLTHKIHLH